MLDPSRADVPRLAYLDAFPRVLPRGVRPPLKTATTEGHPFVLACLVVSEAHRDQRPMHSAVPARIGPMPVARHGLTPADAISRAMIAPASRISARRSRASMSGSALAR